MGIGRIWPTWCRGRSGNTASRIKNDHAAGRNYVGRQDYPQLHRSSTLMRAERESSSCTEARKNRVDTEEHYAPR